VSLLLSASAGAAPLSPADFPSLGTLNVPNSGTLTIDTDQLTLSTPGLSVTGVARPQTSGQAAAPEVAVFTFDTISIGKPVALTVRGARALALLSKDNLTVAGALTFTGTTAVGNNPGVGRLSGGDGGSGGAMRGAAGMPGTGAGGSGGGSGQPATSAVPGSGGGGGSAVAGGGNTPRPPHGTPGAAVPPVTQILQGGGGGGGGGYRTDVTNGDTVGGGGGAGGGAVELGALGDLTVTDPIVVDGTNGGVTGADGGGGGGGALFLHAAKTVSIIGTGALYARAGGSASVNGGSGGRVVITGLGEYRAGTPLPTVDVNGAAVAPRPGTVSFGVYTFTVPAAQSVSLTVPFAPPGFATGRADVQILRDVNVQGGGTLTLAASHAISATVNVRIDRDGNLKLGEFVDAVAGLSGEGNLDLGTGALIVQGAGTSTFAGTTAGSGQLMKSGDGTLTLSGSLGHTGATTLTGGTLEVSGRVSASPILVRGGTLQGSGTVGKVTISGGHLTATASGPLTATDLTVNGGGSVLVASGTGPVVRTSGAVTLAGTLVLADSVTGTVTVIENSGTSPVSGQFGSIRVAGGGTATVNYAGGDGNDVTVEILPGTAATGCTSTPRSPLSPLGLLLLGLPLMALRRRRA
jgi:autotransporter-associated beta strand protein